MEINNPRQAATRKKQPSWPGRLNSWLHLWLGLVSGIIVIIVSLTGTLFVFCDDIIDAFAGDALYVSDVKSQQLTPEELLEKFKEQVPGRRAFYFVAYKDPARTLKIGSSDKQRKLTFTWIDPYTGKVLKSSSAYYFFYVVAHVHSGEMPFGKTGNLIVQIATWIFLIELITGLVLWWPKKWTKATREQSFKIKWKASFKRVNYDLHNVPGFYSLIPALMLTVTGLIIVNKTLNQATHRLFDGKTEPYAAMRKIKPDFDSSKQPAPLKNVVDQLLLSGNDIRQVRIEMPASDSASSFLAIAAKDIGLKGIADGRMFSVNKYTGKEVELPASVTKGLKIEGLTMNLHIGFWAGWWGKIVTFIVGLICTALPITGFLIWLGRRNKKRKSVTTNLKAVAA